MTTTLDTILARARALGEAHKKADVPDDMKVEHNFLDYGDSITRPSIASGLHRVHLTSANKVEMTRECCEFFVLAANETAALVSALEMLCEQNRMLKDAVTEECCCTGELHWMHQTPIKCDSCDALAAAHELEKAFEVQHGK